MKLSFREYEELLPEYFSGEVSEADRLKVDQCRSASPEYEEIFQNSSKAWESLILLQEMEQFNSFEALKKVNLKLVKPHRFNWLDFAKKIAAVLLLPLLVYSGYLTQNNSALKRMMTEHVVMQTITSHQGMVSKFLLADGTKVWLNSNSELQFPNNFIGNFREVKLNGEAYFEVEKNMNQPFRVNADELNIEVHGTSFNVASYKTEASSEVILVEGKVSLSGIHGSKKMEYGSMQPGQRAVYDEKTQNVSSEMVNVDKYVAWRDGNLIFRNDNMDEVVKRLSRWFNVEIVINDPTVKGYVYKATFRNENLVQVLNLLKISAPIDYRITDRVLLPNGEFTKQKVFLMKKKV